MRRPSLFWWSIGSIALHAAMVGAFLFLVWSPRVESRPLEINVIEVGVSTDAREMEGASSRSAGASHKTPSPFTPLPQGGEGEGEGSQNPSITKAADSGSLQQLSSGQGAPYEMVLASWLERQKQYPPLAKKSGVEGRVAVRIVLAQTGTVAAASIIESSGSGLLDREALAMVKRADPFPPLPTASYTAPFEFIAPIRFTLK